MRILLAFPVLLLVVGCERNARIFEKELDVFGTFAQISIAGLPPETANQAALAVGKDLQALDNTGDSTGAGSELQQLNEAIAQGRSMTVSDGLIELINAAMQLSAATGGLFNPAAGELSALREVECDSDECSELPYPDEVQRLIDERTAEILSRPPSMDDLIISGNTVRSRNPLVKLEFGDMLPGLALDKGIEQLQRMGVSNAMVDIGGSVRTIGKRGDHDWWIGIPDADGRRRVGSIENIDDQAVVTVRDFDKVFGSRRGPVYRHIVDPRSGLPVQHLRSVTVVHDNAMMANAAALTLLIVGIEDWKRVAGVQQIDQILMITTDGTIYVSPAMEHNIHWKQGIEHQHLVR
jgi:thiamine biosynthesis lipoprotein